MAWGDAWGSGPRESHKELAKAFWEGRTKWKSRDRSIGVSANSYSFVFYYYRTAIARRVKQEAIPSMVADALNDQSWGCRALEFTSGRADAATARHLQALGVDAKFQTRKRPFLMNGVAVKSGEWYTLEELAAMPKWVEPKKQPRPERFVNLSMPLFT